MPLNKLRQHLERREYLLARREAERLIQMGELVGEQLIQAYRGAALANYYLQDVHAAVKLSERALENAISLGNWELIGRVRYQLGEFHLTLGDYHQAQDYLMEFLADLPYYPEAERLMGWVHHKLGMIYRYRKQFEESLVAHNLAAGIHRQNGDLRATMEAFRGLIWCHLTMGEPDQAWPYIQEINVYLQENPDDGLAASLLNDMAYYFQQSGDLKSSMAYCAEAMVPGRPGVDDHILAAACVIAGENAAVLRQREEAQMFTSMAEEYALRSLQPALINRAVSLRRHLLQPDIGPTADR